MLAQPRKIRLVARQAEATKRELLAMRLQRATAQYDIGETHPNQLRDQRSRGALIGVSKKSSAPTGG